MALTTQERTNITKLVVAMFNAAPGATYLADLTTVFEANGRSLSGLAKDLANTTAFKALNPVFQTAAEFASKFLTPLGLQANQEAVDFITAKFNAGVSKGQIAFDAASALDASTSPTFADAKAILNNKTAVSEYYSVTKEIAQLNVGTLQQVISSVTKDVASVATAQTAIDNGAGAAAGNTFVLTAALDNLVGTSGNDMFVGDFASTSGADQINGGSGVDTLNLFGAGASPVLPTLTGVERLVLTTPTAVLAADVSTVSGLTEVVLKNVASGGSITVGNGVAVTVDGSVAAHTVVNSGTALTASVGVTNGTTVGTLTVDGAAVKTFNIASNGTAANTITTLTGTAGASSVANSTLNITGSQKLTITGVLDTDFMTVDASTNTGGVSVVFGANVVKATGGTGNDKFDFGANLTVADKVDGGAGIDTVSVTGGASYTTAVLAGLNGVTNVETVEFTGAAGTTVALGSVAGTLTNAAITKVLFNTADIFTADVVNGADTAHTYAFGSSNTGAATLNLATGVTTVNVSLEGSAAVGVVGALTVTPLPADLAATPALVNTVNIASSGTAGIGANTVASLVAQAGSTFKIAGSNDLTIAAVTNKAIIDASAFTGKLVITGSVKADSITLGSAADTVNVGASGSTYTNLDTITGFVKADTLNLAGVTVTSAASLVKFDATSSVSFEQALISAETLSNGTTAAYFNFSGNTYVVGNTDGVNSATVVGSTDLVVKIAGVQTLTADATGIHGA